MIDAIVKALGDKADYYLKFSAPKISRDRLHVPGPDWVDRIFAPSDRSPRVLVNLQRLFGAGRLAGTGYLSILPVDQGIEHSAGASFAKNPDYFDALNLYGLFKYQQGKHEAAFERKATRIHPRSAQQPRQCPFGFRRRRVRACKF